MIRDRYAFRDVTPGNQASDLEALLRGSLEGERKGPG
jgi:hypothetical protein